MNRSATISGTPPTTRLSDGPPWTVVEPLRLWRRRHRTRQQLSRLPASRLRDLGLSEADRAHELRKWFWQS